MSWIDDLLDPSKASTFVEQGTEQWEQLRAGRFTSSEIWKIMDCGFRNMTPEELAARPKSGVGSKTTRVPDPSKMGAKGITYVNQKVAEVLTGSPKPSSYAYPLVYGKETEPLAVEFFENVTGLKCEEIGFQTWGEHAGGSPDRIIGDEGLEIKCPYQSENQIEYLLLTDVWDLKANYPEYYWQVVSLMLFCDKKRWHFCTYDPRMIDDKHKLTHLTIEYDTVKEDMNLIVTALEGAIKLKLEMLHRLK
jgi:hypothetical protein